jgi:Flp pilus assembly protein TadG
MSRNRIRNEDGQSMVEFAIVLPLLALLLFGIIQFGIVFRNYLAVTDAVRVGARKAAVSRQHANPPAVATAAAKKAAGDLGGAMNVSIVSTWKAGEDVKVTGSYPYQINLLGIVVKSGNMTSTITERVE